MPGLKVTPSQLAALGTAVTRVSADVRGQHQGLKGQLSPLFGAEWSGTAAAHVTSTTPTSPLWGNKFTANV